MDMTVIRNRVRVLAVILALALAGGLLTLALLAKPSQAQDQGATSEKFPITGGIIDASACTGELIELTGTMHIVNHSMDLGDGQYYITSHFNLAGVKAVGQTTGDEYVVPAASTTVENSVASGQTIVGTAQINLVIGKGQSPDQVATSQVHYILEVVDGEPTVKVETVHFSFECH
jgi:hypothetical protein